MEPIANWRVPVLLIESHISLFQTISENQTKHIKGQFSFPELGIAILPLFFLDLYIFLSFT